MMELKERKRDLGLYVHVPFCKSKCIYCDFLSFGGSSQSVQHSYVEALCREIAAYQTVAGNYVVRSIFIGGGTPSYVDASLIVRILGKIRTVFEVAEDAEITIEGNPDSLLPEKLAVYRQAGINRLSIGLQSANDKVLLMLNRPHCYVQFEEVFYNARQAGFGNINVDIMSGLPAESRDSYIRTLECITGVMPEHISAYSLIVEEGTPLCENQELLGRLPTEEEDRELYAETKNFLKDKGYLRYEISNYAREDFACRHNIGYWTGQEYLGFGLGASSLLKIDMENGKRKPVRFCGVDNLEQYIRNFSACEDMGEDQYQLREEFSVPPFGEEWSENGGLDERGQVWSFIRDYYSDVHVSDRKDEMEEFMFLGLRMMEGISKDIFQKKFEVAIECVYGKIIDKYVKNGLLVQSNGRIFLTDRGIDVSNVVMAEFML